MMTAASTKAAGTGQHRKVEGSPPAAAQQVRIFDSLELSAERRS
jgi:hypothetical protein